jgi:hypothetical protein
LISGTSILPDHAQNFAFIVVAIFGFAFFLEVLVRPSPDRKSFSKQLVKQLKDTGFSNPTFFVPFAALLLLVVAALFIMAASYAVKMLWTALASAATSSPGLGMGALVIGLIGAPFVIWRSIVAQKTVNVQEQGQITDRINKAVEGLGAVKTQKDIYETPRYKKKDGEWVWDEDGNPVQARRPDGEPLIDVKEVERTVPNLEVRIGAIYALERIAQDSDRDHVQIMEILCAYIRENAKTSDLTPREPPFEYAAPRVDLQAAIDVIGRRPESRKTKEKTQKYRLDLRGTDLSFANFTNGDFSAAIFANCRLEACKFRDADFSGVMFHSSVLNFSEFFRCNLTGARFDASVINRPTAKAGGWVSSINMGELKGASFPSADLSALQHLGSKDKMNQIMGSQDTILSPSLKLKMPHEEVMEQNIFRGMPDLDNENIQALKQIEDAGFKYWFPFDAKRDMAFGPTRKAFLQQMGLDYWPFTGE